MKPVCDGCGRPMTLMDEEHYPISPHCMRWCICTLKGCRKPGQQTTYLTCTEDCRRKAKKK